MRCSLLLHLLIAAVLSGCSALLPGGSTDTPSGFDSFEAAQSAANRIVPLRTQLAELRALGFDPEGGTNVTLIPYPDIAARLAPYPALPLSALDPGVRMCIEAQADCRGYLFHFERQDRHRTGGFWPDFLNFRRTTAIKGWWFDALVVTSNGIVLFRNVAGQPQTERVEQQRNPLGPLQPAGEAAGAALIR